MKKNFFLLLACFSSHFVVHATRKGKEKTIARLGFASTKYTGKFNNGGENAKMCKEIGSFCKKNRKVGDGGSTPAIKTICGNENNIQKTNGQEVILARFMKNNQ
jgi:hypothetical protein